jgi:hypothetical protein
MIGSPKKSLVLLLATLLVSCCLLSTTTAFVPVHQHSQLTRYHTKPVTSPFTTTTTASTTTTALQERRWNFNSGQSPWGLKKNAEIWNGRVSQMAFVFVFLQELIQGKGVIEGLREGDPVNIACAGAFAVTLLGLTAFLAFKGNNDYTKE